MNTKTCICTRTALLANGIIHYIRLFSPETSVEICHSLSELMNVEELQSAIILIDIRLCGSDSVLGLEKIKKINSIGQLIGIHDHKLSDRILPLFDQLINLNAGDEELRNLFEKIYISSVNSSVGAEDNRLISFRESEILKYVALGLTNKEIADQLNISAHTVITHRKNITAKLGIKTIAGLTVYAILNNIIKAEEVN